MDKREVEIGTKEVIALNSRYTSDEIEMSDTLDMYISSFMADRFARELKRKFSKVDTTELTNSLFSSIKKVGQLVDNIYESYET